MAQKKYLCMQRAAAMPPGSGGARPSPAQMQEMYARFDAWMKQYAANIVDMGGRLGAGKRVTSDGALDGPFVESKEVIGGYMILAAGSLDEAIAVASACPGVVGPGSSVDVREILVPGG